MSPFSTRPPSKEDERALRLKRLAQSTPEAKERARLRRARERSARKRDDHIYASTQESISATPDGLELSLKKRRLNKTNTQTSPSLHRSKGKIPVPYAASTPHNTSESRRLKPLERSRASTVSLEKHKNPSRQVGVRSSNIQVPSSPDQDSIMLSLHPVPFMDISILQPEAQASVPHEKHCVADHTNLQKLPQDRIQDSQPVAEHIGNTKNSRTQTPQTARGIVNTGQGDDLANLSLQNVTNNKAHETLGQMYEEWIQANPVNMDQLSDMIHQGGSAALEDFCGQFDNAVDFSAFKKVLSRCFPACLFPRSQRDAFRTITDRFLEEERLTANEFREFLENDNQGVLQVFWAEVQEDINLGDLTQQERLEIARETYAEVPRNIVGVLASNNPDEMTTSIEGRQKHQISEDSTVSGGNGHSEPLFLEEDSVSEDVRPVDTPSCSPEGASTDTQKSLGIPVSPIKAVPRQKRQRKSLLSSMQPAPAKDSPQNSDQRGQSDTSASRFTHKQRSSRTVPSDKCHAELVWKEHKIRNPNFVFRQGTLRPSEKKIVEEAIDKFLYNEKLTRDQLCELFHDKTRAKRISFMNPLIYCIPERKVKNMREYFRKLLIPFDKRSTFTPAELENLARYVRIHGRSWSVIGDLMNRFREDCQHAYLRHIEPQSQEKQDGPWSEEELAKFAEIMADQSLNETVNWNTVSEALGTRTARQCFDHDRASKRTDASYCRRPRKSSTGVLESEKSIGSKAPKRVVARAKAPAKFVPSMTEMDLLPLLDRLAEANLESLDSLPDELNLREYGYDLKQVLSLLTSERKKIPRWRSLSSKQTLQRMKARLEARLSEASQEL